MIAENTARIGGGGTLRKRWIDGIRPYRPPAGGEPLGDTVAGALSLLRERAGIRIVNAPGAETPEGGG